MLAGADATLAGTVGCAGGEGAGGREVDGVLVEVLAHPAVSAWRVHQA